MQGPPSQFPLALTIDDFPFMTARGGVLLEADPDVVSAVSADILAALGPRPAGVFVNCGLLEGHEPLLEAWRDAGHAIGNHTAFHSSAAHTGHEAWMGEVRACDGLWPGGDASTRWFRFPYLWRGETVEARERALSGLRDAGYVPVPVTADSHDWLFEQALRRSGGAASAALRARYVENVVDAVQEARQISRDKLGREAAQILLLHVNSITAATLALVLSALESEGARVVSVEEAMQDPLYSQPDAWAGPGARWWLARTEPLARPDGQPWYTDREARLRRELDDLLEPTR